MVDKVTFLINGAIIIGVFGFILKNQ
jgi:hypothetical protein